MSLIHPVILSGGSGSRLWPLSRTLFPKQLLALNGERSLIQETVRRALSGDFEPPLIVCNVEHRFLIAEQMREADIAPAAIVLEAEGRNTAPAAAVAAILVAAKDPGALMMLMPADHVIGDEVAFRDAVRCAEPAAAAGYLVAFGITPASPEKTYGYIRKGSPLVSLNGCFSVRQFVEKPDEDTVATYVASGDYNWNSGIFLFQAASFLAELERLEPDLLAKCRAAVAAGKQDMDFFRLEATAFSGVRPISIDYAVMEKTDKGAVVPVEMGWSDISSWDSLWNASPRDDAGNAVKGDVLQHGARNSYLRSEGPLVAAVGVEDMVVVATADAVLVSHKSASEDVKQIVEQLKAQGRELHNAHRKVFRAWGSYEGIDSGEGFQVKHIIVNPGAKLSLQMHHKRAEHWIVVSGQAQVTLGDRVFPLRANESTYITLGFKHRLENTGVEPLHLIEVQSGSYLGEDDIVRFEDTYGRK